MATRIKAYIDTSAFIAFLDRSDSFHPLFLQLFSEPPSLVTTPLVIAEGQGWFLRRYDVTRALQFMNFIESLKPLTIYPVGKKEIQEATRYLRRFSDEELTLADTTGLWLMTKQKTDQCWSTDRHLGLTGKSLIIHER
ncbi:MAG: type II toxin-antitoxin system VapC family toxin [Deltaproteobacteria bacterium]|nr:type II toxin-antitoxin system VapC family toxin [Deltaproteobacteria bacterium]